MTPGGMGSTHKRPEDPRGGAQGEKKATNADHDQKIAENRKRILENDRKDATPSGLRDAPMKGDPSPPSPDAVLDQNKDRPSPDADNERKSGDMVSGRSEHEQFPGTQAGYDDRRDEQRPPTEANDDLGHLDRGRNDDLSGLDKGEMPPMK